MPNTAVLIVSLASLCSISRAPAQSLAMDTEGLAYLALPRSMNLLAKTSTNAPPSGTASDHNDDVTETKSGKPTPRGPEGSTYIPLDSWVYPAASRLYSLGYLNTMYLSMRPYTRQSLLHLLNDTRQDVLDGSSDEAKEIFASLDDYLRDEAIAGTPARGKVYGIESVYTRLSGITGTPLNDSYHLGQTIVNDYGRPYQSGFNSIVGFSTLAEQNRFSFYLRGEFQQAPSATGYSQALASQLSQGEGSYMGDQVPFSGFNLNPRTIPVGPIAAQHTFHLVEATLSYHLMGHEISGGKSDAWQGPAQGGAMSWSNNAQNIYSFRVDRVEPLNIPLFSYLFGTVRYDFFYGSLKGHNYPNSPYIHSEQIEFRPTVNSEIGFARTVIFGGEGHQPVTFHTFLKSFFSLADTEGDVSVKTTPDDPGARFSDFSFSWRLPFLRKYATLLLDSFCHDDVSPISAPRRAAYRTGIYLSQIPHLNKLDLRVEAVSTDPAVSRSVDGLFFYWEQVQRNGYTNEGNIIGDWIGREGKGGQAWLTYHFSPKEYILAEFLTKKNDKDFIPGQYNPATQTFGPGGTTQNQIKFEGVKRFKHDGLEVKLSFQNEGWKAPIYRTGKQNDNVIAGSFVFYPSLAKHLPGD